MFEVGIKELFIAMMALPLVFAAVFGSGFLGSLRFIERQQARFTRPN